METYEPDSTTSIINDEIIDDHKCSLKNFNNVATFSNIKEFRNYYNNQFSHIIPFLHKICVHMRSNRMVMLWNSEDCEMNKSDVLIIYGKPKTKRSAVEKCVIELNCDSFKLYLLSKNGHINFKQ